MHVCVCVLGGRSGREGGWIKEEVGVGGQTDGRGYAWLKGTRWEEVDGGDVVVGGGAESEGPRACVCESRHILLFPWAKLILECIPPFFTDHANPGPFANRRDSIHPAK